MHLHLALEEHALLYRLLVRLLQFGVCLRRLLVGLGLLLGLRRLLLGNSLLLGMRRLLLNPGLLLQLRHGLLLGLSLLVRLL